MTEQTNTLETLSSNIIQWAEEKGILSFSDSKTQCLKFISEAGEVADAAAVGDREALKDGIGDVFVTLVLLAELNNLTVPECVQAAYDVISKRTGQMVNGIFVKDA